MNDKTGNLRRQNSEIIGDADKHNADPQPDTVFPEIFIKGFKMLQPKNLSKSK